MLNLITRLLDYIEYDSKQAIYAKLIDGKFSPESPAILGDATSLPLEQVKDKYVYFSRNDLALEAMDSYSGSQLALDGWTEEDWEENRFCWKEAAQYLIAQKNQLFAVH